MHNAGLPLPTQSTKGRARCFRGAAIDIAGTHPHVHEVHMMDPLNGGRSPSPAARP
jgi:hypothetical protein